MIILKILVAIYGLLSIAYLCIFTYLGDSQEREQNKRSDDEWI
ncbi:hypothetical protein [Staphylococcus edaphicus]|nr:hypothetical protein [Staphylococcus edaphicus]